MVIKIPTFSIPKHNKIYPNWDFWFENKPSGNTVPDRGTNPGCFRVSSYFLKALTFSPSGSPIQFDFVGLSVTDNCI
jgi:hypothetical protein